MFNNRSTIGRTNILVHTDGLYVSCCVAVGPCRYEFFAPIWRVMRDDNMAVSEVQRQIEAVALAVKQGSSVSDLRHHTFTSKLKGAQVRTA